MTATRRVLLGALALCFLLASVAGERKPNSVRFVFLVDTSAAMAKHKATISKAVADSIQGGLGGRIESGDLFALWTFDQAVDTNRYLPITWSPRQRDRVATRLARALSDQLFQGEARVSEALPELSKLVARGEPLTAVIIHNGREILSGNRLDAAPGDPANAPGSESSNFPDKVYATTLQAEARQVIYCVTAELRSNGAAPARTADVAQARKPAPSPLEIAPASKAGVWRPTTTPGNSKPAVSSKDPTISVASEPNRAVQRQDNSDPVAPTSEPALASSAPVVALATESAAEPSLGGTNQAGAAVQPAAPPPEPSRRGELALSAAALTQESEALSPADERQAPAVLAPALSAVVQPTPERNLERVKVSGGAEPSPEPRPTVPASEASAARVEPRSPPSSKTHVTAAGAESSVKEQPQAVAVTNRPASLPASATPVAAVRSVLPRGVVNTTTAPKGGRAVYLLAGLAMLVCSVIGLSYWLKARAPKYEASLISKSIGTPGNLTPRRSVPRDQPVEVTN